METCLHTAIGTHNVLTVLRTFCHQGAYNLETVSYIVMLQEGNTVLNCFYLWQFDATILFYNVA